MSLTTRSRRAIDPAGTPTPPAPSRPSLVEETTRQLSAEIMASAFKEHGLLPTEQQLIKRLKVSRTVIREATKQLVSRGLVEIQHGRGVRIVNNLHKPLNQSLSLRLPNTKDRLQKLLEVRRYVEPAVARLAAMRVRPEDLKVLHALQDRMLQVPDPATAAELDLEFHRAITHAARNEVFELMLESVADFGRESRLATISEFGWRHAYESHAEILAAVERGDTDAAERAMTRHVEIAAGDLEKHFTEARKPRRR